MVADGPFEGVPALAVRASIRHRSVCQKGGDEGSCFVYIPGIVQQSKRIQPATRAPGCTYCGGETDGDGLVVPRQACNLFGSA